MLRIQGRVLIGCVAFAVLSGGTQAATEMVPFDVQVPLVLKALSYDRSLKSRVAENVRIAVLSPASSSRDVLQDLNASLNSLPSRSLDGLPVAFKEIARNEEGSLERALRSGRWAAVYVMPGFTPQELAQIRRTCEAAHVLLVGADADDIERGTAFAIGARDGKPVIVVNLPATRACGSDFDLALLRLARVIQ
jgi:YfiR/HmsC-like